MTVFMRLEFIWPDLPHALNEHQPWGRPGIEPPLDEVLADPIVQAVMRRDGVSLAALQSVIGHVQLRMRQTQPLGFGPVRLPRPLPSAAAEGGWSPAPFPRSGALFFFSEPTRE
jgi:hypothetical protein